MRIGHLRHRLILQSNTPTRNSMGGAIPTWTTYATLWGSVEPLKGKELLLAQQVNSKVSVIITTRYDSGITNDLRVSSGGVTYEINAVINNKMENETLQLLCTRLD